MLKYCENSFDRDMSFARKYKAEITEKLACNLLRSNQDIEYVHEMTDLPISRIEELKANL